MTTDCGKMQTLSAQERATLALWFKEIPEPELERVLQTAMQSAARGLSELVGRSIYVTSLRLETMPVTQVATSMGDPETEMVGVYMLLEGDLPGQAILMLSLASALTLADMALKLPLGASVRLGNLERSALAEIGNLMISRFLNALATFLRKPKLLHPSPPGVMVDMLGAILDVVVSPLAYTNDDLTIVETAFTRQADADHDWDKTVLVHFWVLPVETDARFEPRAGRRTSA